MTSKSKFHLFLFLFVFCVLCLTTFPVRTIAQTPSITSIPCVMTSSPLDEFHSLRPYQANTMCSSQIDNFARFCGNDLTLKDTITETYPGDGDCTATGDKVNCTFTANVSKPVSINLDEAELPIMGNTEDVINSKSTEESLNSAQKVNEYVSWYLNGIINKAEYSPLDLDKNCIGETTKTAGRCLNTNILGACLTPNPISFINDIPDPTLNADGMSGCGGVKKCCVTINPLAEKVETIDTNKLVNYSGPINKLLPQEIQQQQRAKTVISAKVTRHDQVVACTYGVEIPFADIINQIPFIGRFSVLPEEIGGIPGPCYETGPLSLIPHVKHYLSEWKNHLPPVRAEYPDYIDYQKKYEEWRGKACIEIKIPSIVPVLGGKGVIFCYDDLGNPNYYSTLYPYIPLSSTEDVEGQIKIDSTSSAMNSSTDGTVVTNVKFSNQTPSTLFFSHMEESDQLGSSLQDTYAPKGADKVGDPTNISSETSCKSVEVRSNAGDDLFATSITGTLSYTASFSCQFDLPERTTSCYSDCLKLDLTPNECRHECATNPENIPSTGQTHTETQTCKKDVYVKLSTSSKTPKVDDIWSRLVAGPMAIFKRIFPKTNTSGSVGQIMDIAGSTNITYSGTNVEDTNTDLKLPHIGGISEYFLKGIQTALRPKGYGETIQFTEVAPETPSSCTNGSLQSVPTLPIAEGSCKLKSGNLTIPPTLKSIIEAAAQTYKVPPGLIVGIMYGEGLFDGSNKKDWTEENVKAWATCTKVPDCNETGDDNFMGFTGSDWNDPKNAILSDLQSLDQTKSETSISRCNLIDAIYGLAWNLHDNADGRGGLPATCFGINLSAPVPTSCSWTPEQYESAIKVSESGYSSACHTNAGSCIGGASMAICLTGDTCETIQNRLSYPDTSHNGCIWDIAHSY